MLPPRGTNVADVFSWLVHYNSILWVIDGKKSHKVHDLGGTRSWSKVVMYYIPWLYKEVVYCNRSGFFCFLSCFQSTTISQQLLKIERQNKNILLWGSRAQKICDDLNLQEIGSRSNLHFFSLFSTSIRNK